MEPEKGETAEVKEDKSAAGKSGKGQGSVQGSKMTKSTSTSATTNKPKTSHLAQTYTVSNQGRSTSPGGAKRVQQMNVATNDSQTTGDQSGTDAIKEGNDGSVISKKADEDNQNVQEKPKDACNELQQSDEQHTRPEPPQDRSTDQDEKDSILKKRKEECDEYKTCTDELEEDNRQLKDKIETQQKRNAEQKTKIENLEKESADAKEKNIEHEKTIEGQSEMIQKVENERNDAVKKMKEQEETIKEQKNMIEEKESTIEYFQNKLITANQQNESLKNKIRKQEKELGENKRDKENMVSEYRELKERFGKVAGAKMKHDNPDIINLGDKHRSTKVAEEYNTTYNETWTDASAALTDSGKLSDEEATKTLLEILKNCHVFCQKEADVQFDSLKYVLLNPIQSVDGSAKAPPAGVVVSPPTITTLMEIRKEISIEAVKQVKDAYMKHLDKDTGYDTERVSLVRPYIEKCVEVCWGMVLNLPPLYMEFEVKAGTHVDNNLYTKRSSGDNIKALVWPPLFNGKGGGLLSKGVVEAEKTVKKR